MIREILLDSYAFPSAMPFPHAKYDDAIDAETIRAINREWPAQPWQNHTHGYSDKRGCQSLEHFGPFTRATFEWLNGSMVSVLAGLTGIRDLSSDPHLLGGGLHETFCGGFLGIHADFNKHPETRLYRRLNLLLYLNEGWQSEWGGALELWDREKKGCHVKIDPVAGRCVIFATSTTSFHGHPEPLKCPPDRSRRSIALYYYSAEPPDEETREHSTLYVGDEENWFAR